MTSFRKNLESWAPALFMMALIFLSSSTKGSTIDETSFNTETYHIVGHLTLFFFLCISYYKATKNIIYSIILSLIYALFDEYHQKFTLGRSPSLFDIKVDIIGAAVAGICLWKLKVLLPEKLKSWLTS